MLVPRPRKGVRGLARVKQHGARAGQVGKRPQKGLPRAVSNLCTNSSRRHSHTTATTTGAGISAERPIPGDARRSLLGPAQDRVDEDPVLIRTEPITPRPGGGAPAANRRTLSDTGGCNQT
jgi:hypothetical protein